MLVDATEYSICIKYISYDPERLWHLLTVFKEEEGPRLPGLECGPRSLKILDIPPPNGEGSMYAMVL